MTIILNASSGGGDKKEDARRLAGIFRAAGIEPVIHLVREGAAMTGLAREAVRAGEQVVVAGGGDGTIRSVAAAVIGTSSALGILPLGTLNHFAKDLNIPLDLEGAARTVLDGRVAVVDAGEVNGHVFINNSSIGIYPLIVRLRNRQQKELGRGRWFAFFLAATRVLRRFPVLFVRLEADGKVIVRTTPFVLVGNNEYEMEKFGLGNRSVMNRGQLWLCVSPHRVSRWGFLRLALRAVFGRLKPGRDYMGLNVSEVWIETRRRQLRVALDGEVSHLDPPLRYRSRPGELRVIVPAAGE